VADVAARFGATRTPTDDGGEILTLSHPDDIAGPLAAAVVEAGGSITALDITEASLEDAILTLTDRTARTAAVPA
jgi:ABC-2 type transport system ATP-binding protein